ncbi:MAG: AMP-binding protein [Chloroflexi bacterium]|nr:AMP-binding protein [Chloroflexota bacterium]
MKVPSKPPRYYNRELETMSLEEIKKHQLQGIKSLLEKVYRHSKFYREHLQKAGVKPDDINSLEDFTHKVPFLTKPDLIKDQEANPPFGNRLPIEENQIRQVNITSGTSGMGQEVYALTEEDVRWGAESTFYHLSAVGLEKGDTSAVLWPIATMAGGLIAFNGSRMYGLNTMLLHIFDSKMKLQTMKRFSPHHFWATPAYLTRLTVLCDEMGIVPHRDFPRLKGITLSTEPFPIEWGQRMEEIWGCTIHDMYGSTQLGSGYAATCEGGVVPGGKRGCYHLLDWTVFLEIINPQTGEPAKYGEEGEPIVTTFQRNGCPLIRFRQGDKIRLLPPGACDCGRTANVWECGTISRYDDMIKIKATNVWPQAVDDVLFKYDEIDEYHGRVFIGDGGREVARVTLEFRKHITDGELKQRILSQLPEELRRKTGVSIEVEEAPYGTVPRFEYKARRWTDEREVGLQRVKWVEKG